MKQFDLAFLDLLEFERLFNESAIGEPHEIY
jgi:hypothetical protein